MDQPLKILFMAAEVTPFAKTGGLADVAGALPKALRRMGHDIRIAMPRYGFIPEDKFGLRRIDGEFQVPMNRATETAGVTEGAVGEVPVYMIENPKYFRREGIYLYPDDADRFIFYCRAVMEWIKKIDWAPDVIHCNDWHTAIVPNWLKTIYKDDPFFARAVSVFTIHNLAYQGIFGHRVLEIAGIDRYQFLVPPGAGRDSQINLMGRGLAFADYLNTVSETYAEEILTPEYGEGFDSLLRDRRDRLFGILNGIDYEVMNPQTDPHIYARYDLYHLEGKTVNKVSLQKEAGLKEDPRVPLIGLVSRLSDQKGFDLIRKSIDPLMENTSLQMVVLGTGAEEYHRLFAEIRERYPERVAVYLTFNAGLAQKIYAGSDLFLMPSRFEPCGLGQLIALRYGTIPVVRETGGLADTVKNYRPDTREGNGFTFRSYDATAMYTAIVRALENYGHAEVWRSLIQRAMSADFSWDRSARKYVDLYRRALSSREERPVPPEFAGVPG